MALFIDHSPMGAAKQNQRNAGLRDAVQLSDASLGHGAAELADFSDFFCAQEFLEESDASDVDSVLSIGSVINPLKIGHNVVGFYAVNMVDHWKFAGVRNEGDGDQSMDQTGLDLASLPKIHLSVAEFAPARSKELSIASLESIRTESQAINAANVAKIANFVEAFEVGNGLPFLSERDIHSTGCPSGEDGLAIKSPSVATTSGGLAYMARSTGFCNLDCQ